MSPIRPINHWEFYLSDLKRSFIAMIRKSLRPICFHRCLNLDIIWTYRPLWEYIYARCSVISRQKHHLPLITSGPFERISCKEQKGEYRLLIFNTSLLISPRFPADVQDFRWSEAKAKLTTLNAHSVNEHLTSPWSLRRLQMQTVCAGGVKRVCGIMNVGYQGDQMFETRRLIFTVQNNKCSNIRQMVQVCSLEGIFLL